MMKGVNGEGTRDLTIREYGELAKNTIVRRYIMGLLALAFIFILCL